MLFTANFPMNSISSSWSKQKRKNYWLYFINISHNHTFFHYTICLIYIYCLLFSLFLTFVTLVIANFVFTLFFASSHNHHYISYNSHFIPHNWNFLVIAAVYLTMWLYNRTTATSRNCEFISHCFPFFNFSYFSLNFLIVSLDRTTASILLIINYFSHNFSHLQLLIIHFICHFRSSNCNFFLVTVTLSHNCDFVSSNCDFKPQMWLYLPDLTRYAD